MIEQAEDIWWEPGGPDYDKEREQRLRKAFMALIERDFDFTLNLSVMGLLYPDDVTLVVVGEEQDDEPSLLDWTFTLTGPGFRIVLITFGPSDLTHEDNHFAMLYDDFLDEVEGDWPALKWLTAPPLPESLA